MKAKLYKVLDQYHLYDGDKAIATTIVGNPMLLPNLSKQNCDEIFGVVDVEKLDRKIRGLMMISGTSNGTIDHPNTDKMISLFNKAMELNKDKVFTLEDVIKIFEYCRGGNHPLMKTKSLVDEYLSLQKPKEIEVEIVMGQMRLNSDGVKIGFPDMSLPKLDSENCLILQKI